jgi:hypothetical protein
MKTISNVRVTLSGSIASNGEIYGNGYALSCDHDGAHFHVWKDQEDSEPRGGIIYKNPLVKHGEAGYFSTRRLSVHSTTNAAILAAMEAAAKTEGLFEKARIEKFREHEEEQQKHRAAVTRNMHIAAFTLALDTPASADTVGEAVLNTITFLQSLGYTSGDIHDDLAKAYAKLTGLTQVPASGERL